MKKKRAPFYVYIELKKKEIYIQQLIIKSRWYLIYPISYGFNFFFSFDKENNSIWTSRVTESCEKLYYTQVWMGILIISPPLYFLTFLIYDIAP